MLSKRLLLRLIFLGGLGSVFIPSTSSAGIATAYRDNVDVQVAIAQAISDRYGRGLVLPGSILDMVILLVKADPARAADIVIAAIKTNPSQMFPILRAVFKIVPEQVEHIVTAVLKTFPEANTLPFIVAIICELETLKLPVPDILMERLPPPQKAPPEKSKAATEKDKTQKREPATSHPVKESNSMTPGAVPPPPPPTAPSGRMPPDE